MIKIGLFLMLLLLSQAKASVHAQAIHIVKSNISLIETFKELKKQSGYTVICNASILEEYPTLKLDIKTKNVQLALDEILQPLGLTYKLQGKSIVVRKPKTVNPLKPSDQPIAIIQEIDVQGTVRNTSGEPLAGVTVSWIGNNAQVATNREGRFQLKVRKDARLSFYLMGYNRVEIPISEKPMLITLETSLDALKEVVVVGYGTVKRTDLTGSVSSITEEDIKSSPVVDLTRALQGRTPGVLVTQNAGSPGSEATIRIRGTGSINASNSPLYVVDGFPTGTINNINPADITSMEILKDASSTAIYGSRGSNGVVLVTTKRGQKNQSEINFESYYGTQSVRRTIPLLNSKQYADFINEARTNAGGTAYFDGSSATRPLPENITIDTDWQNEVLSNAPLKQFQLSIVGGENQTRYAVSGNIYQQDGLLKNSKFDRYSVRLNLDREVSKYISLGLNFSANMNNAQAAHAQIGGGSNAGVMNAAINYAPIFPIYNADGSYYRDQSSLNGNLVDNPVGIANEVTDKRLSNRTMINGFVNIKILPQLTFRSSLGGNLDNVKNNYYVTRKIGLGMGTKGTARVTANMGRRWLNENTLTFDKALSDKHHLNALAGFTLEGLYTENVTANAANFNDDFALYNNLGAGATLQRPSSDAGDWALKSYLSRVNYRYDDRYLVTLTARVDGSSRFGPNNKYGFFPSGAFAWRAINESFMKDQQFFTDLKFRVSYGLTGNQEIRDFGYLSLIGNTQYPLGGANPTILTGSIPVGISNLNLSWESNAQTDVGMDMSFWNNRLRITADYYRKRTFDLLFDVNVPQTTGYSSSLQNIGELENKGFEFLLDADLIKNDRFKWNSTFNVTWNKNKILSLDGRQEFTSGEGSGHHGVSNTVLMKVGAPIGDFYGRKVVGIFQSDAEAASSGQSNAKAGDLKYEDINGDGSINDNDRTVIGNGNAPFFGGTTQTFTFKQWELLVFLQGSLGNEILNFSRFDLYNLNGNNNQSTDVLDRWTPSNPSNTIPRANAVGGQRILSSFHIEDGSYLRLKNISLSYNFEAIKIKNLQIKGAKFYIAAQNYWTLTNYKGYDPEVSRFGSTAISQGMDFDGYPNAKTIMVGLNIKI